MTSRAKRGVEGICQQDDPDPREDVHTARSTCAGDDRIARAGLRETGVAIAGATITLARSGYAIRTDASAAFVITEPPGSTFVFTLRAAGYRGDTAAVTPPHRPESSRELALVSEATRKDGAANWVMGDVLASWSPILTTS